MNPGIGGGGGIRLLLKPGREGRGGGGGAKLEKPGRGGGGGGS